MPAEEHLAPDPSRRAQQPYEQGRVAAWHPILIERAADAALAAMPIPLRVLDIGCGAGRLLDEFVLRVPQADLYVGVDPLPDGISAQRRAAEPRLCVVRGAAEALPFRDASFDLVVATMSMAYWADQPAGVAEIARVLAGNGKAVLVEPTRRASGRRNRARTVRQIAALLASAGLQMEDDDVLRRSVLMRPLARVFICSL